LFYLIQCHLEGIQPSVSDIYLSVSISKGTAISGLAELERRGGIRKVSDSDDKRRRLITISSSIADVVHEFVLECKAKLALSGSVGNKNQNEGSASGPVSGEPLINLLHELSHEVRTPLTAIIGFSEMIADEALGPVQPIGYAEYARDIGKAASHLLNSLNERVDSALAEHGVAISLGTLVPIDLEAIVDAVCRVGNDVASRRGVELRRKWGAKNSLVLADTDRLAQAIRKLIEGIISKTPRGQTVDIETSIINDGSTPYVSVRIVSVLSTAPLDPTMQKLRFRDDQILERSITLIRAIAEAHEGYVTSDTDSDAHKIHAICLPLNPQ
ncbi:HAMP domain-containing histidine kinase, partial [Rhodospirillales bacterium]|nr:HAMP domain-containing histidine kinase [Rhodospirillales bacterium]